MATPEVIFTSSLPVELHAVEQGERIAVVDGSTQGDRSLVVETIKGKSGGSKNYPLLAARMTVGPAGWLVKIGSHTMRSTSSKGEPSFIFSMVDEKNPELFYCVVLSKDTPAAELEILEDILGRLTNYHAQEKPKASGLKLPQFSFPQIQLPTEQINELLRKGAEDAQNVLKQAGAAASGAFTAAVDMHKKYAPKPKETPVEVSAALRDKIVKSKQATAAGAAVARGVATGLQAATVEVGTSLMGITKEDGKGAKDKGASGSASGSGSGGLMARPEVKAVGGIGMEILRDVAAVRDAMINAAGEAWGGLKNATVEVFDYQYGEHMAGAVKDSCEVVEGMASMGLAMKMTQPTQVLLTSAKESEGAAGAAAGDKQALSKDQLAAEKAALERERAALAAEKAALEKAKGAAGAGAGQQQPQQQQQQQRGPFGLPFAFGGGGNK